MNILDKMSGGGGGGGDGFNLDTRRSTRHSVVQNAVVGEETAASNQAKIADRREKRARSAGGSGGGGGGVDMDANMDVSADNVFGIIEKCKKCLKGYTHSDFSEERDEVLMVCIEILATKRLTGITSFFNCQVKELLNKIRKEQLLADKYAHLLKACMLFQIAAMHCNIYNIQA